MNLMLTVTLVGIMGVGAAFDLKDRKIPNWLTVSGLALALLVRAVPGDPVLMSGVLGLGLAFLVVLPLFGLGLMGGGDAKLLMVVGALLGPVPFIVAFLYTSVVGGLMALVAAVVSGRLSGLLGRTLAFAMSLVTPGLKGNRLSVSDPSALTIPYGVAIAAGAVLAHFLPLAGLYS